VEATRFLGRLGVRSAVHAAPPERAPLPSDLAAMRGRADATAAERRGLAFRDRAFDVVFVPEVADLPDPGFLLHEVVRVLHPAGVVLVATRNAACLCPISIPPEGGHAEVWTYSRLKALLRTFFPAVRMIGQGPFLGYTFVEYDPRAIPDVRLDTTLLEGRGEDPEFFVAACSPSKELELPLPALFQVPLQEFTVAEAPAAARGEASTEAEALAALSVEESLAEARGESERLRTELAERNVKIARLEQEARRAQEEAADARERAAKLARTMEEERKAEQRKAFDATFARAAQRAEIAAPPPRPPESDAEVRRLRDDLEDRAREAEALRRARDAAERKAAEAEDRARGAERWKTASEEATKRIADLSAKLAAGERQAREAEEVRSRQADAEGARAAASARLAQAEGERDRALAAQRGAAAAANGRVDEAENRMRAQAARVAELEGRAEERERLIEDLMRELRHRPSDVPCAALPDEAPPPEEPTPEDDAIAEAWATAVGEVDALRTAVAQLEGELTGARWRNAELQTAVSELLEDAQDQEAEADRLQGALELAQVAAEEATSELGEREAEAAALRAEAARLRPLADQAAEVGRLVDELRRQAADVTAILGAREAEISALRAAAPQGAAAALAARIDLLRLDLEACRERLARLAEDPRAAPVAADLGEIRAALEAAVARLG
jgi:hypothetical protein